MQYLTFSEYKELGGTVSDEATFISNQRRLESKINYYTFGRVEKMYEEDRLPEEVQLLEVELINSFSNESQEAQKTGIKSYDNGIEKYTYSDTDTDLEKYRNRRIYTTIQNFLWKYPELFYRGKM